MADVFLSYSRRNEAFARRLHTALTGKQLDTWIDWEDIPLTADWWEEIKSGIEQANNFVFVISPAALSSAVCHFEVDYARQVKKRIIPCVCEEPNAEIALGRLAALKLDDSAQERLGDRDLMSMARANWQTLSRHNWLFFADDDAVFSANFDALLAAISMDLEHTRDHTRLLTRALEWDHRERDTSYLLDGVEIDQAEHWLAQAADKDPEVTELQVAYILASREAERHQQQQNRQRLQLFIGALGVLLIVALIAAVGAVDGQNRANANAATATFALGQSEQRGTAVAEQAATATVAQGQAEQGATRVAEQSDVIREQARIAADIRVSQSEDALHSGSRHSALLLGLESLRFYPTVFNPESFSRLIAALSDRVQPVAYFTGVRGVPARPDHAYFIAASSEESHDLQVWDATGNLLATLEHDSRPIGVRWNDDYTRIMTQSENPEANSVTLNLWDLEGNLLTRLSSESFHTNASWHIGQTHILIWKTYAYVQGDFEVLVWDLDGNSLTRLEHEGAVVGATQNADSSRILTWSTDYFGRGERATWLNLWDAQGNKLFSVEHPDQFELIGAAWNADETQILSWFGSGESAEIRVWDTDGNSVKSLTYEGLDLGSVYGFGALEGDRVQPIVWSHDMMLALTHSREIAQVWDLESGKVTELTHDSSVVEAEWNAAQTQIRCWTTNGTFYMWDVKGREISKTEYAHDAPLKGAVWNSAESSVLTWTEDNTAHVWSDNAQLAMLTQTEPIDDMIWAGEDQYIIAWSEANTFPITPASVWIWDTQAAHVATLSYYTGVAGSRWNPDKTRLLTWSEDGTVRIWDQAGNPIRTLEPDWGVSRAIWNGDGSQIITWSVYSDATYIWDAVTGAQVHELQQHGVTGVALNRDESQIMSWGEDGAVRIWSADGQELFHLPHESTVFGATWNADESRIMTWSVDHVLVWDVSTQQIALDLPHSDQGYKVQGAAWNADETRILSWDESSFTKLWDYQGTLLATLEMGSNNGAKWNADGSRILTWTLESFHIRDAEGQPLFGRGHYGEFMGPVWNVDETQLLTWSGTTVQVLTAEGQPLISMEAADSVWGAAWTTDESRIIVWTGSITQVWDTEGNLLNTMEHSLGVAGVFLDNFNPYYPRLVPVEVLDPQQIWPVPIPTLLKDACLHVVRDFIPEEYTQFFLNPDQTIQEICASWMDAEVKSEGGGREYLNSPSTQISQRSQ